MILHDKRLMIVYVVIFLWICFGIIGAIFAASFVSMSVYFLSLTGFIGVYVWGESVRKSNKTSIFIKGESSNREIISYVVMILWAILGVYGILMHKELDQLSAYYAALTPFIGAYILGDTYKNSKRLYTELEETPEILPTTENSDSIVEPSDTENIKL